MAGPVRMPQRLELRLGFLSGVGCDVDGIASEEMLVGCGKDDVCLTEFRVCEEDGCFAFALGRHDLLSTGGL